MSMLDVLEKEFVNLNLTEGNTPNLIKAIANSIPSTTIPYRMKLAIAYSELTLFFSQFRINIDHWNGSSIPVNSITFCLARSGAAKDSSVNMCRKCFQSGYEIIEKYRKDRAKEKAIKMAKDIGKSDPGSFNSYREFYKHPSPLFISISTPEGLVQHINDLENDICGSCNIAISELGSEMAGNPNFGETFKLLSECYDMGNKDVKVLKGRELQSQAIRSFPVNAIILGAVSNIIHDITVKQKFKIEFTSKLARRSFFIYTDDDYIEEEEKDVNTLILEDAEREDRSIAARQEVSDYIKDITPQFFSKSAPKSLKVTEGVRGLFLFYKRYNEAQSAIISDRLPITKLSRAHLQWKALKLSGALALSTGSEEIEGEHYRAAIEYCELIADDIRAFELELTKEPYEHFVKYVHQYEIKGQFSMTLHELRKSGFLFKGLSSTSMRELVKYANSYDNSGSYNYDTRNDLVTYDRTDDSSIILVSYTECTGSKTDRGRKCALEGMRCIETKFTELDELLEGNFAYSCFKFANGIRGKDNIISGNKWLILDIDDSECSDKEADMLLSEINHYTVRTSNPDNEYKYRVILELDREVNIPDYHWTIFINMIGLDLGFIVDKVPKSQIFFSYSTSAKSINKMTEGKPLEVMPYLSKLKAYDVDYGTFKNKKELNISDMQKQNMLDDKLTTFRSAYEAKQGEGTRKLIAAARYARELGATKQYTLDLIQHIAKDYWTVPLDDTRLDTMLRQIGRWQGFTKE